MPRYLKAQDLEPLLESADELDRIIDLIEQSVVDQNTRPKGHAIFSGVPLAGDDQLMVFVNAAEEKPLTIRVFPAGWNVASETASSVLLAFHPVTGQLDTVIEAGDLNRLRTSIPVAVGARHLARPGARTLGMLGSGDQARGSIRAILRAVPTLDEVVVWSPTEAHREAFAAEQSELLGVAVRAVATSDEAVAIADVLMMAGRLQPGEFAFDHTLLKPGSTVLSMSGAAPRPLTESDGLYVPTINRAVPVAVGFLGTRAPRPMMPPEGVRVLADVISGDRAARNEPDEVLLWELANLYLWDQAIAGWVGEWAARTNAGVVL